MSDVVLEITSGDSSLVQVWVFSVSRHSRLFGEIALYLSPEERMRAERFYREADRRRFVLGRAMVRRLCGTHLGVKPETVRLEQTSNGKPYLGCSTEVGGRRLEFNVAHSGDCVLIAWSLGRPVGIDVEALERDPLVLFNEVAATAFSDAERAVLCAAAPHQVAPTFYRTWVRKEALLKAEGCGIGGRLQSFTVACQHEARTEWVDQVLYPDSGRTWRIVDLTLATNHVAALALTEGANVPIEIRTGA